MALLVHLIQDYLAPSPPPLARTDSDIARRLHAACHSPTSTLAHLDTTAMRRELDNTKHDLARAHVDTARLEERCKMLEKTLRDTRDLLRAREAELDRLRRDRDRDRAIAERRRSDSQQQLTHRGSTNSLAAFASVGRHAGSSLDTRMAAADLARRIHLHDLDGRTPSPSTSLYPSTAITPVSSMSDDVSEEDRARIRSAEAFLTRVDTWSGAQVLQAVHDINSEILQFAASATEMCTFLPAPSTASPQASSNPRLAQAIQDTASRIGPHMTRILSTRDHSSDPLLVQLALQGCVSLCIARALNSFCIGFPSKSDAVLAQIYNHMQLSEPQPTFAKWRALTHQHIHGIYPTLGEYSVSELSDTMLRWCSDIFLLANCHSFSVSVPGKNGASASPSSSPTISISPPNSTLPQTPSAQLRHLYLDQIKRISRAVMRLASVTREEIMSTNFEVIIADPNAEFGKSDVVDAFGEYSESEGRILVTMELGLRCVTRVANPANGIGEAGPNGNANANANGNGLVVANGNGNGNGVMGMNGSGKGAAQAGGNDKAEGKFESRLLLQPKVVLESVLEVVDR